MVFKSVIATVVTLLNIAHSHGELAMLGERATVDERNAIDMPEQSLSGSGLCIWFGF